MGEFNINKRNGGLGRTAPSKDMISGLMITAPAAPSGLAFDVTSAELLSLADAEALGINAAYDLAQSILFHHHVVEIFRKNPSAKLYIRSTEDVGTTLATMCNKANAHAKTLLVDAGGNIRNLGVVHNPDGLYNAVQAGGTEQDVLDAIPLAQALADEEEGFKRTVDIVLEGRDFNGTVGAADDLRANECPNVSVCIAADPAISATYNDYAAVGACLGTMSFAKVHEDLGWTGKFNLTDAAESSFESAGLSGNTLSKAIEADWETLHTKGFIFTVKYPGQSGIYFYGAPNCDLITSDYAFIQNSRTINKAMRLLYDGLFHRQNSPVEVDPTSGKLAPEVILDWQSNGEAALSIMEEEGEVSGLDVYVDPDQNVNSTGKVIVKFSLVPVGTARTIEVSIGLVLKLS